VRYELLLQAAEPGAPYAADRVKERLSSRGLTFAPDGSAVWRLKQGEVEVRPLNEGGQQVATELRVPLSDKTALMSELLTEATGVAEEAQVRLFDPQLSRGVSFRDEGAVTDQFHRSARYAGEMLGVSEALPASFAAEEPGLKAGTKVLLGVIALIALVLFLADRIAR